jgi:GNAT superfamily N-acetyltransferase
MVDQAHGHAPEQMMAYRVVRGERTHARALGAVEKAAGARFRDIGMADIADAETTPATILEDRATEGRLYVALADDKPVGFLIWSEKDGRAYIEEVSVHPDHAGHRLAARMIDTLADAVRGRIKMLSLATFRDVAWNAPYYAKLGFVELPYAEAGPEHEANWKRQAEYGLDMSRRLFMTRPV